jgi:hypothetical protein
VCIGATALIAASQQGHVEVVRLLLALEGVEGTEMKMIEKLKR